MAHRVGPSPRQRTVTPPDIATLDTDVVVLGSGGAGLMACLHASTADPSLDVTVISKGAVGRSGCTLMVQGGYNAVLHAEDSVEKHFADTIAGGGHLNDQGLAWTLVEGAPRIIRELEQRVGCYFDRNPDGSIHQKAFAGQSFDRTVHRGDETGLEIMGRLRDAVFATRPRELEDVRALDLVFDPNGEVAGVTVIDVRTGEAIVVRARVVVVATGGAATMYRYAAPAREKTGDGIALLYRAGVVVRDMEMVQFHPTGLMAGRSRLTGSVLEEGLRGAGAHLYNGLGDRFMARYDPDRMERATRDVVARSAYLEIMAGRGTPAGGVMIDISHLGQQEVERRFPGMVARTRLAGFDLSRGPVEVVPTSHFHMGGAVIDPNCHSSVPGLLVAGEDAGGVHGANRLGGNGVAESTVFGAIAGDEAAQMAPDRPHREIDWAGVTESVERARAPLTRGGGESPFEVTRALKDVMWERSGLVREASGLADAREQLSGIAERVDRISVPPDPRMNPAWQEAMDLQSQLIVASLVVESALLRTESRGAHFRSDFPSRDDSNWLTSIVMRAGAEGPVPEYRTVEQHRLAPPVPDVGTQQAAS